MLFGSLDLISESQDLPLWGGENAGDAGYSVADLDLVCGLVSDEYANHENVSTIRQNSLYLPGNYEDAILVTPGIDYIAGAKAFLDAIDPAYTLDPNQAIASVPAGPVDYTGITDVSMLVR
jgi:hypothetical protein